MNLVERLVHDLIDTTNSYRLVQDKESKLAADLSLAQAQLFPLRKEAARLARENHLLHMDNINQADEKRNAIESLTQKIQQLNDEFKELALISRAKDEYLIVKNKEIENLKEV